MSTTILILTPKTNKAKNRINEIVQRHTTWDKRSWAVLRSSEVVLFSDKKGPWSFVEPFVKNKNTTGVKESDTRWIHSSDDDNFTVTQSK